MLKFLINVIEQGSLYAILSMGVMIAYNIIGISDLSVDGSYPLGAVVSAIIITKGGNMYLALIASLIAGLLAGSLTGIFHTKFKISALLSGILVMTGLYSFNLMLAKGRSNIPLLNEKTLFDTDWLIKFNVSETLLKYYKVIVLLIIVLIIKLLVDWLLSTKIGYLLKIIGDNENLVTTLGHDVDKVKIIGLALSNGIVALSGAISVSVSKYYDVSLGSGMVVLGLSSVILGTLLLKKTNLKLTTMVIFGSMIYRLIVALAIKFGIDPQYMKMVTVAIFVIAIVLNNMSFTFNKKGVKNARV